MPTWFPRYGVAIDHGASNATTFGLFGYGLDRRVYLLRLFYYDPVARRKDKTTGELADDFEAWLAESLPGRGITPRSLAGPGKRAPTRRRARPSRPRLQS